MTASTTTYPTLGDRLAAQLAAAKRKPRRARPRPRAKRRKPAPDPPAPASERRRQQTGVGRNSTFEETLYHEAGHAIVCGLEKETAALQLVAAIPFGEVRLLSDKEDLSSCSPRKLRAHGRVAVAGAIAAKLAGVNPSAEVEGGDLDTLHRLRRFSKRGLRFDEECRAGAEFRLRCCWGAVEELVNTLRQCGGAIGPPYTQDFLRMALNKPPRPLFPDIDTFERVCRPLERVPEMREEIMAGLRAARLTGRRRRAA